MVKQRLAQLRDRARGVRALSVREAWLAHEHYAGRAVALTGVVRAFETGTDDEYFTLDDGPQRVGLRGDPAALRALIDRPVRATGTLDFKPGVGIFLVAETIAQVS